MAISSMVCPSKIFEIFGLIVQFITVDVIDFILIGILTPKCQRDELVHAFGDLAFVYVKFYGLITRAGDE